MCESFPVTPDSRVRLFLVEDHQLFRSALQHYLEEVASIEQVGTALPDQRLFDAVLAAQPDVVLLDLGLHPLDPREVIRRLRALVPGVRIVVLSLEYSDDTRQRALAAGADAFVAMERTIDDLLDTLHGMMDPT